MSHELEQLAQLLAQRNEIDDAISRVIGRPALPGHIGEFIASRVFGVVLEASATNKGFDGRFGSGPLVGKTVNVKCYGKREGILDLHPSAVPDYYLVLAGPCEGGGSSRGGTRPFAIAEVFLFEAASLHERLRACGVKIGIASSVTRAEWQAARIYPTSGSAPLALAEEQAAQLALFAGVNEASRVDAHA